MSVTLNITENLYTELKKNKEDYVFIGEQADIIYNLSKYCATNSETLFWFLGGPLLWLFSWRSKSKQYKEDHISKTEKHIIHCLSHYDRTFKNGYCVLVRKDV